MKSAASGRVFVFCGLAGKAFFMRTKGLSKGGLQGRPVVARNCGEILCNGRTLFAPAGEVKILADTKISKSFIDRPQELKRVERGEELEVLRARFEVSYKTSGSKIFDCHQKFQNPCGFSAKTCVFALPD